MGMQGFREIYKEFSVIYTAHIFTRVFIGEVGIVMGTLDTGWLFCLRARAEPRASFCDPRKIFRINTSDIK